MAVCEIVTIGTELLLGEIQDTNSRFIARALRDIGIDLYRLTTVGDNLNRITATLQEALMRADIVITTGGLGPTVDDPTRQAVANVFNVRLVYQEELWQQILDRFSHYNRIPTENNKRQALFRKLNSNTQPGWHSSGILCGTWDKDPDFAARCAT